MQHLVIYVHGNGGSADEAKHYQPLFPGSDVIGFDYHAQTPWEAVTEFPCFFDALAANYDTATLIANSIGAYFSMLALSEKRIARAMFLSPIVNMEKLILDMMARSGVTENALRRSGEMQAASGELLSWNYLCYVREHPIKWHIPTHILYGGADHLTSRETITGFAAEIGASLTVMEGGAHWFHTAEQMRFLDRWIREAAVPHSETLVLQY